MSLFTDDCCNYLQIKSTWKQKIKYVDNSVQTTNETAYELIENSTQTGISGTCLSKIVKQKDENASLLSYCKGRLKK